MAQITKIIRSTEIAIVTPKGILMELRRTDNNFYRMWGSTFESNQTAIEAAIRVLKEDAGLTINADDLKLVNVYCSFSTDKSNNVVKNEIYRFIIEYDIVPVLNIKPHLRGWILLKDSPSSVHVISEHQQFIKILANICFPQPKIIVSKNKISNDVLDQLKQCSR